MSEAIDLLLAGYRSYRALFYEKRGDLTRKLAREGQSPKVLVIACSDSRVDPAVLFNADPGEIFVVRNIAALVPPYTPDDKHHGTSAAIEFAVRDLNVKDIVVLGHSSCGGMKALSKLARGEVVDREFIGPWVEVAHEACQHHAADDPGSNAKVEKGAIKTSLNNLMGFPWIAEAVDAGSLVLHGWWANLHTGDLFAHEPRTGEFHPIVGAV
ncbi:carbonic anhydrase [Nitrococcus mobilis]|uniref:Carbonic anhydrase n=1 Tax=Nitrococcus mobilis Nb-231 TaxID=314278 RepID=A4BLH7_9GAMM|nr:carbonic anhydrase [Nitrococcus mobilis]EAR23165.1 carbonic anhydrase [Nitrococcus mobilis Nb-231]